MLPHELEWHDKVEDRYFEASGRLSEGSRIIYTKGRSRLCEAVDKLSAEGLNALAQQAADYYQAHPDNFSGMDLDFAISHSINKVGRDFFNTMTPGEIMHRELDEMIQADEDMKDLRDQDQNFAEIVLGRYLAVKSIIDGCLPYLRPILSPLVRERIQPLYEANNASWLTSILTYFGPKS